MVGWYEPGTLFRVGIRTMIASVFGQYADQRLIQAATDVAPIETIVNRYNYSNLAEADPERRVAIDEAGAFWIDYIADIGDGFEPTYATAYLLAQSKLEIEGAGSLTAGSVLIMGGDQCYPQATREGYKQRLQTPYDWAFNVEKAERKLFAIPGNHDWYDGLSAFDSLFCSARDRLSQLKGNKIGGWQCMQHRSYWAMELPYRWWIWGCDIQFSHHLDMAQVNYFEAIAGLMSEGDNLIICLAEPTWMIAEAQGLSEDSNFFKITAIARRRGINICAVLAGDWHHYNRYYAPEIDVHLFTAGGGGSFLHPTHVLKDEISITWPRMSGNFAAVEDSAAAEVAARPGNGDVKAERYDLNLKGRNVGGGVIAEAAATLEEALAAPPSRRAERRRKAMQRSAKCYPSKSTSLWLSFRNLAFPITNFWFGLGIGVVYWMITWQFYSIVEQRNISNGAIDAVSPTTYLGLLAYLPLYLVHAMLVSITLVAMLLALWLLLCWYVQAVDRPRWRRYLVKGVVGSLHFLAHVVAMFAIGLAFVMLHNAITPSIKAQIDRIWQQRDAQPDILRDVIKETLEPISPMAVEQRKLRERETIVRQTGEVPRIALDQPLPPLKPIIGDSRTSEDRLPYAEVRKLVGFILYPGEMMVFGGMAGAFIWGLYWVLTGLLGRMHAEDAFAALRIQDYRNFLRMKFEPHQVTIYPLGLDKCPRAHHWMAPPKDRPAAPNNPQLVATRRIDVKLIEDPIVILGMAAHGP